MNTLISVVQLSSLLGQGSIQVFDCRFVLTDPNAGRRAYEQAHIPGAIFVDMNRDLSTPHLPGKTGRHPLPPKSDWISRVRQWGIHPELQVVLYDDNGGASAARLWWMLQWIGHSRVAVLNGGWQAWLGTNMPVTSVVPAPHPPSSFDYAALPSPMTLLTAAQVDARKQTLLDARDRTRFRGDADPVDPVAGHIPGAVCMPFSENLNSSGAFRSADELRARFAPHLHSGHPVVCYCGSGVTACHNILAITIAGLPAPALYAGSWSDWITDAARPVAKGD